jgi:glycosyltransferase involved in cell wall biosynthesis
MNQPKVLIIIPAYNEAETIPELLEQIRSLNQNWDVLVVNDASKDTTEFLARQSGLAEVVSLPFNLGIGGAVQTGFKYAVRKNYDIALQFDGDGQHPAGQILSLIQMVVTGEADVVIGSRFNRKNTGIKTHFMRRTGIKIFEWFSFLLIRQRITDHTSGFRAYNRKAFTFLASNYPTDYPEPEVVILLGKNNFVMKETFTQMHERKGGVSSIPISRGPYYMIKVLLAMFMAAIRSRIIHPEEEL